MTDTSAEHVESLEAILQRLRDGELDVAKARQQVESLIAQPLGFATLDHDRARRCGTAEVVFAAGKTPEQVVAIARELRRRQPCVLITRAGDEHRTALQVAFEQSNNDGEPELTLGSVSGTAIIGKPPQLDVSAIAIITAGTSDGSVAEEAVMTCQALGHPTLAINDVGVAGLHRLGARLEALRSAKAIVCIAGMEGALPSVVGGLVDVPVIAVPTSVGYGAALGGITALLGMLTSCASGVSVVNIDNGFGAAYNACQINRLAAGLRNS